MNIEEVFRKLRPVMGQQLDMLWQEFLVSDTPTRQTIERTLRVMLAQRLSETYESEHVLLKPPPANLASTSVCSAVPAAARPTWPTCYSAAWSGLENHSWCLTGSATTAT